MTQQKIIITEPKPNYSDSFKVEGTTNGKDVQIYRLKNGVWSINK